MFKKYYVLIITAFSLFVYPQVLALERTTHILYMNSCQPIIINFEHDGLGNPLEAGEITQEQWANLGLHITTNGSSTPAMIFNSANPTGGDFDLGSPNQDFGGPGIGSGGRRGAAGENSLAFHHILILSDGNPAEPRENGEGGRYIFSFDKATAVLEIGLIDIDDDNDGSPIQGYDTNGQLVYTAHMVDLGDNSVQKVLLPNTPIKRLEVHMHDSGAVTDFSFCTPSDDATPTSSPTAVPPTATSTFTPQPTQTETAVPPTATSTFTPRPTSTETAVPPTATSTFTPLPTSTETAVPPTVTSTFTPRPTSTETAVPPIVNSTFTPRPTSTETVAIPTATRLASIPTSTSIPAHPTTVRPDITIPTSTQTPKPPLAATIEPTLVSNLPTRPPVIAELPSTTATATATPISTPTALATAAEARITPFDPSDANTRETETAVVLVGDSFINSTPSEQSMSPNTPINQAPARGPSRRTSPKNKTLNPWVLSLIIATIAAIIGEIFGAILKSLLSYYQFKKVQESHDYNVAEHIAQRDTDLEAEGVREQTDLLKQILHELSELNQDKD